MCVHICVYVSVCVYYMYVGVFFQILRDILFYYVCMCVCVCACMYMCVCL